MANNLKSKRFNERVKLMATTSNTLAIALFISGVIFPLVREGDAEIWSRKETWIWIVTSLILHLYAHRFLGLLRAED